MVTLKALGFLVEFSRDFIASWQDPGPHSALQSLALLLMLMVPPMILQYQTLKHCKAWYLRWLPLVALTAALVMAEVKTATVSGWEHLGWQIFTTWIVYGTVGALLGVFVRHLSQLKNNQK